MFVNIANFSTSRFVRPSHAGDLNIQMKFLVGTLFFVTSKSSNARSIIVNIS